MHSSKALQNISRQWVKHDMGIHELFTPSKICLARGRLWAVWSVKQTWMNVPWTTVDAVNLPSARTYLTILSVPVLMDTAETDSPAQVRLQSAVSLQKNFKGVSVKRQPFYWYVYCRPIFAQFLNTVLVPCLRVLKNTNCVERKCSLDVQSDCLESDL